MSSSCGGCAPPVDTSTGISIDPCGSSTASILKENEDSRQVSEQTTAATTDEVSKTAGHKSRKVGRWRSQGSRIPRPSSGKLTHPRTLNSMLCGCLSSRVDHAVPSESPIAGASVQLLPSSVLQSMKRLSLTFNGDYDFSTESANEPSQTPCHKHSTLNLPSSAIFTDILSHSKVEKQHGLKSTRVGQRTKRDRSLWRNFRLHRRKEPGQKPNGGSVNPPCTTSNNSVDQLPDDQVLELSDQQNSDVNEALVFSPLPSQAIPEPTSADHHTALLGPRNEKDKGKKCFVIDLDETLVHSSFKVVEQADFKVGVEIDGITHRVYVLKRPHVDVFLSTMANLYECVLFTASLAKYADPVADFIDKWNAFRYRLFRESCVYHRGNYVKDLSHLGRPINQVVILDNSPASYMFHANHAVQISSWFDDANDHVLLDLIPYFERLASHPNVVEFLRTNPPPTPYAAVGTVGLPPSVMTQPSPPADMAGRSVDSSTVISNIRRPAVASPLPVPTLSTRAPSRSEVQYCPEPRKGQPATVQRILPANALPVITKLAAPSSGPYVGPTKPKNESAASFPAPLCLATSSSVTPPSSYPVSVSNSTSGTSSQGRVPNPLNNSHNFPGTVGRGTSSSTGTTTSLSSLLRPYRPSPLGLMGPQINSKVSTLSTSKMLTKQRQSDDNAPTCVVKLDDADRKTPAPSLVSESQYPILSTVPRQIGTVKSVVGDAPPVQTISPLAALAHVSTSTQRIHP